MVDPKNDCFYKIDTLYSVSLNPPDQHQYFSKPKRFSMFYDFCNTQLLRMGGRYVFYIELSEPHGFHTALSFKGPRLHLHGFVWFEDVTSLRGFLAAGYYNLTRWTSTDFDTVGDPLVWKRYMRKQKVVPVRYRKITNHFSGMQEPTQLANTSE